MPADKQIDTGGGAYFGGRIWAEQNSTVVGRDQYNLNVTIVLPQASVTLPSLRFPVPDFTGRAEHILPARQALQQGRVVCINGMAGIGKTQLALAVAAQLKDEFPGGQFGLDLRGMSDRPMDSDEAQQTILRAFLPAGTQLPNDPADLAGKYQGLLSQQRILLLLDNAADTAQVQPLLPPAPSGALLTSRRRLSLPRAKRIDLSVLPSAEARQLLQAALESRSATARQIDRLAALCGYLPLALRIVGSYLEVHVDIDVSEYSRSLARQRTRLRQLKYENLDVEAVVRLSYERLRREHEEWALHWLQLAVFPATFDRAAAAAIWSVPVKAAGEVLSGLFVSNLLTYYPDTRRYHLHELLRDFGAERLPPAAAAQARERFESFYRRYAHRHAQVTRRDFDALEKETPNLFAALDQALAANRDRSVVDLVSSLVRLWDTRGYWSYTEKYLLAALEASQRLGDHEAHAHLTMVQGLAAYARDDYAEAQELFQISLDEALAHAAHEAALKSCYQLALVLSEIKQHRQAVDVLRPVLAGAALLPHPNWALMIACHQLLGKCLMLMDHFDLAEQELQTSHRLGRQHHFEGYEYFYFYFSGVNDYRRGQLGKARGHLRHALRGAKTIGDQEAIAEICIYLGRLELRLGRPKQARQYLQTAYEIARRIQSKAIQTELETEFGALIDVVPD
jgi:tetratricopeptide (TPR) repeat protein